jgi:hypothetical protein
MVLHAMKREMKKLVHDSIVPPKPIPGENISLVGNYVMAQLQITANCLFLIYKTNITNF